MMKQFLKSVLLMSFLISVDGMAHDMDNGILPVSASASSIWYVTCSDDGNGGEPINLAVSMNNKTKNGPMVSLQIITHQTPPKFFNIADPVGGDNQSSAEISTKSGSSHYILVNKSSSGQVAYHFTYHCMSASGHTGTEIQQIQ